MKKGYVAAFVVGGVLVLSAASAEAGPIHHRQDNQRGRIAHGVESGRLTARESAALRHEQRAIDHARHRALSDGYLSYHEARRLDRAQNRAGRHIYRLKHNWRVAR